MSEAVQCYFLPSTHDAPNSRLPVLHYQNVLPFPRIESIAREFLTTHEWEHRVSLSGRAELSRAPLTVLLNQGTWGHISIRHFHPNTHECYGELLPVNIELFTAMAGRS